MGASKVETLVQTLPTLSLAELRQLGEAVERTLKAKQTPKKPKADERPCCPACHAEQPYRWGKSGATPRWRCRSCGKTFTTISGTPLAYAKRRPELLEAAIDMLGDNPRSCRKLAKALGVHRMTVWRWRLKVLRAIEGYGDRALAGLVEADETFFRESRKGSREWALHRKGQGPQPPRPRWRDFDWKIAKLPRGLSRWQIPVLVLRDRHDATCARRLPSLRGTAFDPVLDEVLAPDAMLCTDNAAVYRRWGKARNRVVEQVNSSRGIRVRDGVFHIQNANAYHSRFKDFMRPFRGPSARHLNLYIAWMAFRDRLRGTAIRGNPLIERLLQDGRKPDTTRRKATP
jgi:transposase-like protein